MAGGKTCETQHYLPHLGEERRERWVWTQALEVLILGLKCRTTKVLRRPLGGG